MGTTDASPERYVVDDLGDGAVRMYDTENEDAWIRSDTTVALGWQN